jgi:hypothetical protein
MELIALDRDLEVVSAERRYAGAHDASSESILPIRRIEG